MKKLSIGLVAINGVLVVSCAKDYNCECIVTHVEANITWGISDTNIEATSSSMTGKEDDMKSACEGTGFNMSYIDDIQTKHTITSVCKIK